MHKSSKLLFAVLAAAALLGMAVSTASARNIELVNWERGFRISWSELRFEVTGRNVECPVTLEGSFARHTFAKVRGTRIGSIGNLAVGTCFRNLMTVLRETLPWELTYDSFAGTLPDITSMTWDFVRMALRFNIEGVECLATTRTEQPARGIATVASGRVTGFRLDETATIETFMGFFCSFPGPAHFAGTANSVTVRGGTEAISVRLI